MVNVKQTHRNPKFIPVKKIKTAGVGDRLAEEWLKFRSGGKAVIGRCPSDQGDRRPRRHAIRLAGRPLFLTAPRSAFPAIRSNFNGDDVAKGHDLDFTLTDAKRLNE